MTDNASTGGIEGFNEDIEGYDDNTDDGKPDTGDVFDLTSGEQIRIDYNQVYLYRSANNGKRTVVEIGWADKHESFTLAIPFTTFDQKRMDNAKAWSDYWGSCYD